MQWFRMYSEFATDPKIQSLPEIMQRRYVMLLCMKCNGDLRYVTESNGKSNGDVALRITATALRITEEETRETINEFIKLGLITENWEIKNWEKRQYISDIKDPTNRDRQKRYRERHPDKKRNGSVTDKKRPDTDTERKVVVDDPAENQFVEISKEIQKLMKGKILQTQGVHSWLKAGADRELILDTIKALLAKRNGDPPQSLSYFNGAIANAIRTKNQTLKIGDANATNPGNYTASHSSGRRSKKAQLDDEFKRALADNQAQFDSASIPG